MKNPFEIIDSKIFDYFHHLILPWSILIIGIGSLITLLTRLNLMNKFKSRSIVTNSFNIGIIFSIISTYLLFVEFTFDLGGIAQLSYLAIRYTDYYIIDTILFLIPMFSVVLIVLGSFIFIGYDSRKNKQIPNRSPNKKVNKEFNNLGQGNFKHIDIDIK